MPVGLLFEEPNLYKGTMWLIKYCIFETAKGWSGAAFSEAGLIRVILPVPNKSEACEELAPKECWQENGENSYTEEIKRYLAGEEAALDLPVDFSWATPFQREVLEAAKAIPYGQTETYGSLAARIGRPKAARAVGGALGRNKVPLVVP